jgi:hypothetical protein
LGVKENLYNQFKKKSLRAGIISHMEYTGEKKIKSKKNATL